MPPKTLTTEIILENDLFRLKKDRLQKENGEIIEEYYTIDRPDVAIIVTITKDGRLVLLDQYRHPIKKSGIEVPAGHINKGEPIEEGAKRELLEETGYSAAKFTKIYENYASIGLLNQKLHFFLATEAEKNHDQNLDKDEELTVTLKTWEETEKLLVEGHIQDIDSVAAILLAKKYLQNPTGHP
ncbi:NUDIX hydrolase [Candidatus Peregrinibacteria bacterium]|nr:NUDIX hydrolase [Candidatus Peregrinibacteria bacterium]